MLNGQDGPDSAQLIDGGFLPPREETKWSINCRRSVIVTGEEVCIKHGVFCLQDGELLLAQEPPLEKDWSCAK
jgi:hypothetical protein